MALALSGVGAVQLAAIEVDDGDLDHPGVADIEAGGLDVQRGAVDGEERRRPQQIGHASPLF